MRKLATPGGLEPPTFSLEVIGRGVTTGNRPQRLRCKTPAILLLSGQSLPIDGHAD